MFRRRRAEAEGIAATPGAQPGPGGPLGCERHPSARRYRMTQRMVSIGDDFYIQDDQGNRVFKVDGKALRVRDTIVFRDMNGNDLCRIQERVVRVKDTMDVDGANGESLAHIKKAMITPLRDRYVIKIGNGPDLDVQGNILDHEFRITDGRTTVAEVSKKWFRVRDSYGVEIGPGQNDIVILAATVCIDKMSNPGN